MYIINTRRIITLTSKQEHLQQKDQCKKSSSTNARRATTKTNKQEVTHLQKE
jgi:hypothetical protein